MVREQVLKTGKFNRTELLFRADKIRTSPNLVFNFTYHPAFSKLKSILDNIHLLLTSDSEHRRVFQSIFLVGFKRGKSLKDILVRAKVPKIKKFLLCFVIVLIQKGAKIFVF